MIKDDMKNLKLAVLIDGENISHDYAEMIYDEVAKYGKDKKAITSRIYLSHTFNGWEIETLSKYDIDPIVVSHTIGKNSTDIALVLDAMDFVNSNKYDGFFIVSSDSDFALLINRIRKEDKFKVIGLGDNRTTTAFKNACDKFIQFNEYKKNIKKIERTLLNFYKIGSEKKGSEALNLAGLERLLRENVPDFNLKDYGCSKLSQLIRKTGRFKCIVAEGGEMSICEKEKD